MTDETAEARAARRAAERKATAEAVERDLAANYLAPIPADWKYAELQAEHARLRTKIQELQMMVLKGRLTPADEQTFERRLVEQIHKVEERAARQ
ncbi:MAG: hypothetical protein ACT4PT_09585 [Methanobacteriota archaeon]